MVDEAVAHGDDCIGTGHFLLALFCDDNAAAQVLTRLGAGEREVRAGGPGACRDRVLLHPVWGVF